MKKIIILLAAVLTSTLITTAQNQPGVTVYHFTGNPEYTKVFSIDEDLSIVFNTDRYARFFENNEITDSVHYYLYSLFVFDMNECEENWFVKMENSVFSIESKLELADSIVGAIIEGTQEDIGFFMYINGVPSEPMPVSRDFTVTFWKDTTGVSVPVNEQIDFNIFMQNGELKINSDFDVENVKVYNPLGQLLKDAKVHGRDLYLNLSELKKGIYIVSVNNRCSKKIYVE